MSQTKDVLATSAVGLALVFAPVATSTAPPQATSTSAPTAYTYRVVKAYPHDSRAFTQGLIYRDGYLFESTGLQGRSSLRKVRLDTGAVIQRRDVDAKYFAEGLTDWGGRLIQLTWQTNVGFVYDINTFTLQSMFNYPGEGWGLTHDGRRLIMSDGSSTLRFLNPATLREIGRVVVKVAGAELSRVNELEFMRGEILANVWQTDRVARIDPASGRVTGMIDFSGLLPPADRIGADVLNGIAYDKDGDRLFVTGKLWPRLFEVRLERRQ